MKTTLVIILLFVCAVVFAQNFEVYQNLRHSSRDANGNLHLRWEAMQDMAGLQYEVYHSLGGAWQNAAVNSLEGLSQEALLPYEFGQHLRYRMRAEMSYMEESMVFMQPAFLDSDSFPLPPDHMALIGNDPVGDSLMVYSNDLDITDSYIATSDARLYRAMGNSSGSFPTMLSLTKYNVYACGITNPQAASDTLLYAMVYSFNIPGILSNGLYKIGMGDSAIPSFTRLGNIQAQVSNGRLHMSCNWADLLADPDFGGWPNMFNALILADLSMQVSIDMVTMNPEVAIGDYGVPSLVEFLDMAYEVAQNTLPQLKVDYYDPDSGQIQLLYSDADQDFPLEASVYITDDQGGFISTDMIPNYNPDGSITFLENAGANISYKVSDNGIDYVNLGPVANSDPVQVPIPALSLRLPNPISSNQQLVDIQLSGLQKAALSMSIYNVKGQKVLDLPGLNPTEESAVYTWNRAGYPILANGIYFMRLSQQGQHSVKRFIISN